jgi:sugar-specific transcriptional regulator TrmB/DNA-binding CsgD family transcriptional regulator
VLQSVGVTESDEEIYRALLRGTASTRSLATATKRTPGDVDKSLRRLVSLGLARPDQHGRFVAVDPEAAVGALIRRRHSDLDAVQAAKQEFVNLFNSARLAADASHVISVISGPEEAIQRIQELMTHATRYVVAFDQPPYMDPGFDEIAAEAPVLLRGVPVRVIYDRRALDIRGRFATATTLVGLGEQSRVLPSLPLKLSVIDDTAIVPLTAAVDHDPGIAIVRPGALCDALVDLFERFWSKARPTIPQEPPATERLTKEDARILRMMDEGYTDAVIARQLEMNQRSVGRRIHALLAQLGATTRFQAGARAYERGLLSDRR